MSSADSADYRALARSLLGLLGLLEVARQTLADEDAPQVTRQFTVAEVCDDLRIA